MYLSTIKGGSDSTMKSFPKLISTISGIEYPLEYDKEIVEQLEEKFK